MADKKLKILFTNPLSKSFLQAIIAFDKNKFSIGFLPLIKIVELEKKEVNFSNFNKLFFSSKNGLSSFIKQYGTEVLQKKSIISLGSSISEVLRENGVQNFLESDEKSIEGVAKANLIQANDTVLYVRGNLLADEHFFETIKQSCTHLSELIIYSTEIIKYEEDTLEAMGITEMNMLVFTSPSAVQSFLENYKGQINFDLAVIGSTTEKELSKNGLVARVKPQNPNYQELVKSIITYYGNN